MPSSARSRPRRRIRCSASSMSRRSDAVRAQDLVHVQLVERAGSRMLDPVDAAGGDQGCPTANRRRGSPPPLDAPARAPRERRCRPMRTSAGQPRRGRARRSGATVHACRQSRSRPVLRTSRSRRTRLVQRGAVAHRAKPYAAASAPTCSAVARRAKPYPRRQRARRLVRRAKRGAVARRAKPYPSRQRARRLVRHAKRGAVARRAKPYPSRQRASAPTCSAREARCCRPKGEAIPQQAASAPTCSAREARCCRPKGEAINRVELRGFEPRTFSLRTRRATNCAIAPCEPRTHDNTRRAAG